MNMLGKLFGKKDEPEVSFVAKVELTDGTTWRIPLKHGDMDIDLVYDATLIKMRAADGDEVLFPVRNVLSILIPGKKG